MQHNHGSITPIARIFKLVQSESKNIRYLYSYAVIAGAISLILPLGIQSMMGLVIGGRLSPGWLLLVIVITVGVLLAGVTRLAQISILENIQQRMFFDNAVAFSEKITALSSKYRGRSGIVQASEKFLDIITLQKSFSKLVLDFTASVLQIAFGLMLLAIYHPAFLLFGGILVSVLALVIRFTWKAGIATARFESDYKFKTAYWLLEIAKNRSLFSLPGNQGFHLRKTDSLLQGYFKGRNEHFRIIVRQATIAIILKVILAASLLILGSWLLVSENISMGQFLASEILIITLLSAVEKLVLTVENIYDSGIALEKLGTVSDLDETKNKPVTAIHLEGPPQITLISAHNEQIRFEVKAGQKIGIAGLPGTGRTGFLHAILGEVHPDWEAEINGLISKGHLLEGFNTRTGICYQNETLFEGTLIENIALNSEVDSKKLLNVATITGIGPFVNSLEQSYNHVVDANSSGIPNNIIKKIMLARALYNAHDLLLIDDIWAVFTRKEIDQILDYIHKLGPTTVIISNQLPVLQQTDMVAHVDAGNVFTYNTPLALPIPEPLHSIIWQ